MSRASEKKTTEAEVVQDQVQNQEAEVVQDDASTKGKSYTVKVKGNPTYCGVGAGDVQFANGQAVITSERMAAWFKEHDGYEVTEE